MTSFLLVLLAGAARFLDVTEAVGLDFVHDAGEDGRYLLPEITGSGAAFVDYDQDGDLDIYLVQSGRGKR
ncbi:MAG TPA: CRTAC1 family protein, partial [Vicinamibacteria bacterium]|nr:CRTAC1 family protein [Vicinamibacteria bacterium]